MTTSLQETVVSTGTLGTLATNDANMYVRDFPFNSTVAQLLKLGMDVPDDALPSRNYLGPDRLVVRTVRTMVLREEEHLRITATIVRQNASRLVELTLHWRLMGNPPDKWHTIRPDVTPS